jgi:ABC-type transport system involved in multi-copper enzyme maturation permease subunit
MEHRARNIEHGTQNTEHEGVSREEKRREGYYWSIISVVLYIDLCATLVFLIIEHTLMTKGVRKRQEGDYYQDFVTVVLWIATIFIVVGHRLIAKELHRGIIFTILCTVACIGLGLDLYSRLSNMH